MAAGHDPREIDDYPVFDMMLYDIALPVIRAKASPLYQED